MSTRDGRNSRRSALGLLACVLAGTLAIHGALAADAPEPRRVFGSGESLPVGSTPTGCVSLPDPGEDGKIAHVRNYVEAQHAPSMAGIAVVHDGVLVATTGIGGADGETTFWIASSSKFVTAVGAVVLLQEGLLDTHDAVTEYIVAFTENHGRQDQILIEHLLQNRSGLVVSGISSCVGHTGDGPYGQISVRSTPAEFRPQLPIFGIRECAR